jgi:hypothetical protein
MTYWYMATQRGTVHLTDAPHLFSPRSDGGWDGMTLCGRQMVSATEWHPDVETSDGTRATCNLCRRVARLPEAIA